MKHLLKISALAAFAVVGAFAITSLTPSKAVAQEQTDQQQEQQTENQEQNTASYAYTAQPGDSYTKIARKAVQTFGIVKNVGLSQAQIVAAETFLTSEAGFPSLNVGQEVTLNESDIDAAVKKAQGLDDAAIARWEKYVPFVNFNTDNVGEAR